jgi:hypothetical protein
MSAAELLPFGRHLPTKVQRAQLRGIGAWQMTSKVVFSASKLRARVGEEISM